jgi:restriction system protein
MAIPDFQTIMLPLLRLAGDGLEHEVSAAAEDLAKFFGLSQDDWEELVPSGTQRKFSNRVTWAVSYLKHALLLEKVRRGRFRITENGRQLLANPPERITIRYLEERYPAFHEFRARAAAGSRQSAVVVVPSQDRLEEDTQTPEERLDAADRSLRANLEQELLERVKALSPAFFERLVLRLVVRMGYGGSEEEAAEHLGRSGDDGVDGVIKEDPLGLDVVFLQAKRWGDQPVRRPDVQAFAGSLEGQRARKGVFITTSHFTRDAHEYVSRIEKRIVLIDGEHLARLMIEHRVGVIETKNYSLLRLDESDFEDGDA